MASVNRLIFFSGYFVLLLFLALNAAVQETNAEKDVPLTRLGQSVGVPTLKIFYW